MSNLRFALPPSLGAQTVRTLAREFAAVLYEAGFTTVVPLSSYESVERSILDGEVDAAWGPPLVCARVQEAGGTVALRAVRGKSSTYRSALLCRAHDDLKLDEIGVSGLRRLRAAWVDLHSMGGYLMPRHHLRMNGIDPAQAFESERVLGSYKACFDAVMACEADIAASYATARGLGHVELCGSEAHQLRVFAYTDECSNDGVVVSPRIGDAEAVSNKLAALLTTPAHRRVFCAALNVDDLDVPPPNAYLPLLALHK